MSFKTFCHSENVPTPERGDVHAGAKYHRTHSRGKQGAKGEFTWMHVLTGDGSRHFVLVMDFVDVRVDPLEVQETVGKVKDKIFAEHAENALEDEHLDRWNIFHLCAVSEQLRVGNLRVREDGDGDQVVELGEEDGHFEELLPSFRVGVPWPLLISRLVALNEFELVVVENVEDQVGGVVDDSVVDHADQEE